MIARHARRSLIILVAVAAVVRADAPSPQQLAAAAQAAAVGRRTVAVVAQATVVYPCDQFAVVLIANSGVVAPDDAAAKIDELASHAQDALRIAGLGALQLDERDRPRQSKQMADRKIVVYRRYRIPVASFEAGRAVQACLVPFTSEHENEVNEKAAFAPSRVEASSAKLAADPKAALADARRQALVNGRTEAEQNAKALGMRLGPPVSIGVIDASNAGTIESKEQAVEASGTVVFEMLE